MASRITNQPSMLPPPSLLLSPWAGPPAVESPQVSLDLWDLLQQRQIRSSDVSLGAAVKACEAGHILVI